MVSEPTHTEITEQFNQIYYYTIFLINLFESQFEMLTSTII